MAANKVRIQYRGPADVRKILKSDWTQRGVDVDDQEAVVWDADNQFVAEVSENAANYLKANDSYFVDAPAE